MIYLTIINVVMVLTLLITSEGQRRERRQWAQAAAEERRELLTRIQHPQLVPVAPVTPNKLSPADEAREEEDARFEDEIGLVGSISHGGSE